MKILVIGASARAAAQSVKRAGYEVAALDLFVDRDLREIADCESIRQYPDSIVVQANRWPDHTILLCGGMENFPDVVAELEKRHSVIGPNASQIRALRSLENWQNWVVEFGGDEWLRFPMTRAVADFENRRTNLLSLAELDGWLSKSRRSAGGMHVFRSSDSASEAISDVYMQRYTLGPVLGVTFSCHAVRTSILGVMRNLTLSELTLSEKASSNTMPFLYSGSEGPYFMAADLKTNLENWVHKIARSIEYRGVLQADFILGDDGYLYLLEFNPRWTASMELIEMSFNRNLIEEQLRVQFQQRSSMVPQSKLASRSVALAQKRIVYATRSLKVSSAFSDAMMERSNWLTAPPSFTGSRAGWADIPHGGTLIEVGSPIATIWAIRTVEGVPDLSRIHESSSPVGRWPEIDGLLEMFTSHHA